MSELDDQVDKYCIKITGSYEGTGEPEPPMEVEVEGNVTSCELTNRDGLKPLLGYRFDVQAIRHHKKGAWSSVECFVGKKEFKITVPYILLTLSYMLEACSCYRVVYGIYRM